jgi:hypothetical protein
LIKSIYQAKKIDFINPCDHAPYFNSLVVEFDNDSDYQSRAGVENLAVCLGGHPLAQYSEVFQGARSFHYPGASPTFRR